MNDNSYFDINDFRDSTAHDNINDYLKKDLFLKSLNELSSNTKDLINYYHENLYSSVQKFPNDTLCFIDENANLSILFPKETSCWEMIKFTSF